MSTNSGLFWVFHQGFQVGGEVDIVTSLAFIVLWLYNHEARQDQLHNCITMKKIPKPAAPCTPSTAGANRESFEAIAELFRVFGDATRLQILQALTGGEKNVGQLVEELGMTQANISKHLKTLHDSRILRREKRGTATYYAIDDDFIHPLCELICDKLNRSYEQPATTFSFSI